MENKYVAPYRVREAQFRGVAGYNVVDGNERLYRFCLLAPTAHTLAQALNLMAADVLKAQLRATGTRVVDYDEDECPHDEHDHGICLECGKDIMDDLVGAAEMAADAAQDR